MIRETAMLGMVLALSACSGSSDPAPPPTDAMANSATTGLTAQTMPTPVPTEATQTTKGSVAALMPAAFGGRWGLVPADCDPARADNKGLMTIEPDRIRFYESRARIASVTQTSPTSITAELDFAGEGQTWHETTRFTRSGTSLTRQVQDPDINLTYQRCPT